ncbi:MAG: fumarylacetoacetate hydrolase family protein [Bacteroidetes bacterium]|jgi:fumarylacetoacetate (FAA) hydrolase|nr:fumarylacetoacetate hydrolase family protein [Bacteroidota bacterium]HQW47060.1 fumarylacetoacetate hydrolase family protein [Chitinophagaceae bacterium]MBK6818456.1 fumarylacetoacetate hydrolase family protein [Bacteroidota bacterium]MBK7040738.1 fumarylacetoacetate hydrolase family protein [Bacteroidota bacterium]MBK7588424.1 fumarylacetoacetate hydrolase family protein [Bacteroidota bacterium]
MKLVTHLHNGNENLALLINNKLYNVSDADVLLPATMQALLEHWEDNIEKLQTLEKKIIKGQLLEHHFTYFQEASIMAPVPKPTSCRDGYAFRQHVASARRNRKVDMIAEFDQYPIFYFTNHNAIQGPGNIVCMPDHFQKLDFELEVAIVVCKKGRNIKAAEADSYIGGYMIMNDMSARTLQMEEMLLNLGPAKGKDFSTVIGPMLVTPDELEPYKIPCKENHTGNNYNLKMTCKVNGVQVSEGSVGDMDWTFAEILERCAYGVDILPGDVIGSGTVGTGCFLELNGTGLLNDPQYKVQWLQEGDEVEMAIDGLGILKNKIVKEESEFSILALKKK